MVVKFYFRQVPQSWAVSTRVALASERVAIHASIRQAMDYGVHGSLAARQFKLLAFQTSFVVCSNYAIKGTAVKRLDSSFASCAAVPYFGC